MAIVVYAPALAMSQSKCLQPVINSLVYLNNESGIKVFLFYSKFSYLNIYYQLD